jgi:hypothetical protein
MNQDNDDGNAPAQGGLADPALPRPKKAKREKKDKKPSADGLSEKNSSSLGVYRSLLIELATMLNDDKTAHLVRSDVVSVGIIRQIAEKVIKNDSERGHDYHILGLAKKAMENCPNPQTQTPSPGPAASGKAPVKGSIDLGNKGQDKKVKEPSAPPVRRVRLVGGLESCLTMARKNQLAIIEDDFEFARSLHLIANSHKADRAEDDNRSVIDFMFAEHRTEYNAFLTSALNLGRRKDTASREILFMTPNGELGKPLLFKPLPSKALAAGQSLPQFPAWKDLEGRLLMKAPEEADQEVVEWH